MGVNPNVVFVLFIGIILFGYFFKRVGLIKTEDSKSIINIILYFTLPAVILKTFYHAELNFSLLIVFLASLGYGIGMTFLGLYLFRKNNKQIHKGLLISSCMGFNIGLFAYPFVQALWGQKGLLNIAVFDLANAFIVFGSSYVAATIYSPSIKKVDCIFILKKLAVFVPLQCYVIAIIFVFLPINYPPFFMHFLDIVSQANTLLVLLVIGMFLSFNTSKENLDATLRILGLRYATGVLFGLILFFFLPVPEDIKKTIFLGLIMPVGMSAIPYAVMFDYDTKLAGSLVNISNCLSFVLMWIFISII